MTTAAVIIEKVSFSLLDKCDNNPFLEQAVAIIGILKKGLVP